MSKLTKLKNKIKNSKYNFFKISGLKKQGFKGFLTISNLSENLDLVPLEAGVYVVARVVDEQPAFLKDNPGGRFKGKNPTEDIEKLKSNWVDNTHVIYIGKANDNSKKLRSRLKSFLDFGSGKAVGHWGGRYVWQVQNSEDFLIAWKISENAEELESKLLNQFEVIFGRLPFANLRH